MKQEILHILPVRLREGMQKSLSGQAAAEEIRIRIGQPPEIRLKDKSVWLPEYIRSEDIEEMLTFISRYSIYAYEEEIRQGFLTIEGGHRIGFAGQIRMKGGQVHTMTNIRFLNIRIASEQKGCAKGLLPFIYDKESRILNTLFVSEPGIGKTTFLRDCIRLVSDGGNGRDGKKVCVIDERSELAACHLGIPQNDIGRRTDVIDGCPKHAGMFMALRSMSPEVIAVDELGGQEDADAVKQALLYGCKILGTVHGETIGHTVRLEGIRQICKDRLVGRFVFLKKNKNGDRFFEVYDQEHGRIC